MNHESKCDPWSVIRTYCQRGGICLISEIDELPRNMSHICTMHTQHCMHETRSLWMWRRAKQFTFYLSVVFHLFYQWFNHKWISCKHKHLLQCRIYKMPDKIERNDFTECQHWTALHSIWMRLAVIFITQVIRFVCVCIYPFLLRLASGSDQIRSKTDISNSWFNLYT